jgi:two-component system response regulator YesN
MFRVLIVDDEPSIREGLKTIISWNDLGFKIAGVAANGKEALARHQELAPDLMLVDIRMPGMDGLELIEQIRKVDANTYFLILTGYADFQYAKKAIQHKVEGYILKPVDEEEIVSYIEKVRSNLDQKADTKLRKMEDQLWQRERWIQDLILDSRITDDSKKTAAEEMLKAEGQFDSWQEYQVLLLKLQDEDRMDSGLLAEVKQILKSAYEVTGKGIVFSSPMEPYIGILLKRKLKEESSLRRMYQELLQHMKESTSRFFAAAGECVHQLEEIAVSYETASKIVDNQFFVPDGEIGHSGISPLMNIISSDLSSVEGYQPSLFDWTVFADKFYYVLDIGNTKLVHEMITEMTTRMIESRYSEKMIKTSFVQLLSTTLNKLASTHPMLPSQSISERILQIYHQPTIYYLQEEMQQITADIVQLLVKESKDTVLKQIVDFIHRHHHESLRLETIAELFHYNSAYLGKLFKSFTGEYFNTYLDKVRIEKAKELLQQGIKVNEAAKRVGYENVDYFYSKFKKYVGSSPSSYKKIYK